MRRGANLVCLGTWFDLGTTLLNATAPSRTKMVRAMGFQLKNDIFSVPTSVTYTWPKPTERQTNVTSSLQCSPTNMFCLKGILPYCIACQAVWASVVMIQGQKSLQSVAILALLKLENSLYFRTCAFLRASSQTSRSLSWVNDWSSKESISLVVVGTTGNNHHPIFLTRTVTINLLKLFVSCLWPWIRQNGKFRSWNISHLIFGRTLFGTFLVNN